MREWETDELHEQISQATLLLKKLLATPENSELRHVCENWIEEHKQYIPDEPAGYDVSLLDGIDEHLNF